jgi:hypothetical protein
MKTILLILLATTITRMPYMLFQSKTPTATIGNKKMYWYFNGETKVWETRYHRSDTPVAPTKEMLDMMGISPGEVPGY